MNKLPTLDVFMHRAAIDPQKNRSLGFQWLFEKKMSRQPVILISGC